MTEQRPIRVSASISSADPELITRAIEAFSRAGTGIALEGAEVCIVVGPDEDEPDEQDETDGA